jgi:hypothetical protein
VCAFDLKPEGDKSREQSDHFENRLPDFLNFNKQNHSRPTSGYRPHLRPETFGKNETPIPNIFRGIDRRFLAPSTLLRIIFGRRHKAAKP